MQIGTKNNRAFVVNILLGLIPEIIVAGGIALISGEGWDTFFIVLLGLQILYFFIWVKNSLWAWSLYTYKGRKQLRSFCLEHLKKKNYPEPLDYVASFEDYLSGIVGNKELPDDIRISAALDLGSMEYPKSHLRLQESLRMNMAFEDALESYKATFSNTEKSMTGNEAILDIDSRDEDAFIKIVHRVNVKCGFAANDLKTMAGGENELSKLAKENFEEAVIECYALINEIDDDFYKSTATHALANLLSQAGQYDQAHNLIELIEVDFIKEKALKFLEDSKAEKAVA